MGPLLLGLAPLLSRSAACGGSCVGGRPVGLPACRAPASLWGGACTVLSGLLRGPCNKGPRRCAKKKRARGYGGLLPPRAHRMTSWNKTMGKRSFLASLAGMYAKPSHNQAGRGPTGPCTGFNRFLLSSGCEWGEYYSMAHSAGLIPNKTQIPCRALVACL